MKYLNKNEIDPVVKIEFNFLPYASQQLLQKHQIIK